MSAASSLNFGDTVRSTPYRPTSPPPTLPPEPPTPPPAALFVRGTANCERRVKMRLQISSAPLVEAASLPPARRLPPGSRIGEERPPLPPSAPLPVRGSAVAGGVTDRSSSSTCRCAPVTYGSTPRAQKNTCVRVIRWAFRVSCGQTVAHRRRRETIRKWKSILSGGFGDHYSIIPCKHRVNTESTPSQHGMK